MTIADEIRNHLSADGIVQITTCTQSTIYKRRHADYFTMRDGSLYVRHGRHQNKLSIGERLLVAIRFGRLRPVNSTQQDKEFT